MNGRVYDYNVGRFMSVDPVIQSPTNSQSINPYSYIMNNPLAGTDPTGYSCSGTRIGNPGGSICGGDNHAQQNAKLPAKTNKGNGKNNGQGPRSKPIHKNTTDIGGQKQQNSRPSDMNDYQSAFQFPDDGIERMTVTCDSDCQRDAKPVKDVKYGSSNAMVLLGAFALAEPTPFGELALVFVLVVSMAIPGDTPDVKTIKMRGASESATGGPDPEEDEYENPGHHDPSGQGPNSYNRNKSVLPKNHQELWRASRKASDGNRWAKVGKGKKAVYHRFQNDGTGKWHWNGSTNGATKSGQPRAIKINNVPRDVQKW